MIKPDAQFKNVTIISVDFLKSKNIKAIILDVDNTLIDLEKKPLENIENWINTIKNSGFKICIASNSIKKNKVKKIADKLEIPYVFFSLKPFKYGLKKAKRILNVESNYIAEIGDQLFTDVLGAKRMKMYSILTTPIAIEKNAFSKIKRKVEKIVLNKL